MIVADWFDVRLCITYHSHIFESVWFVDYDVNIHCVFVCVWERVCVFKGGHSVRVKLSQTYWLLHSRIWSFCFSSLFVLSCFTQVLILLIVRCVCGSRAHFLQSKDDFRMDGKPHLKSRLTYQLRQFRNSWCVWALHLLFFSQGPIRNVFIYCFDRCTWWRIQRTKMANLMHTAEQTFAFCETKIIPKHQLTWMCF